MKYIMLLTMLFSVLAGPQGFAQTATQAQNTDTQYLPNAGFENGKAGWVTYKNTAQALPVTGQGGTATSTLTTSTTAPISGKASGILTHPASSVQGEGISMPFSLDKDARGQSMQIRGKYEIVSGTYSGGSGLPTPTDSDLEVYVYDVDAGQLIQPSAYKLDGGVIGNTYIINANFQASNTSSNYRLIFHYATISANAFVVRLDSLKVSSVIKTFGVPAYDLQPAGVNQISASTGAVTKGTTATDIVRLGRVGDHARIRGEYKQTSAGGGVTNADILIALPNGLSFDSNKVSFYVGNLNVNGTSNWPTQIGLGTATVNNTSSSLIGMVIPYDATHFRIAGDYNSGSSATAGYLGSTFGIASTALTWSYDFEAPIAGWSSNVQMSDGGTTSAVVATYAISTAQSVASGAVIKYDTRLSDTTSSFSTATGLFTAPSSGNYRLSLTAASGGNGFVYYKISGAAGGNLAYVANTGYPISASASFPLLAGQTVGIYLDPSANAQSFLAPSATFGYLNTVSFEKLATPQTIASGESVNATYGLTTAQAPGSGAILKYDTKVKDTHGAFSTSTGLFTAPVSGTYRVSVVGATDTPGTMYVKVSGAAAGGLFTIPTANYLGSGSISVPLITGQTVGIYNNNGGNFLGIGGTYGYQNQVTFEKTGN